MSDSPRRGYRQRTLQPPNIVPNSSIADAATHRLGGFLQVVCVKTDGKPFDSILPSRGSANGLISGQAILPVTILVRKPALT
jgi:hypothetical protein